jgi:hypothetical protein
VEKDLHFVKWATTMKDVLEDVKNLVNEGEGKEKCETKDEGEITVPCVDS